MWKKYSDGIQIKETKKSPKIETLNALLNYSKSLKVIELKRNKVLLNLN